VTKKEVVVTEESVGKNGEIQLTFEIKKEGSGARKPEPR